MAWESTWLNGFKKLALNVPPYDNGSFNPADSGFTNEILFVRESGVTESGSGSPTGVIYMNGVKYADGFDTYINNVTYLNGGDEKHPYSLEFNYIDGSKDTFYVHIDDIDSIYTTIDQLSGSVDEQFSGVYYTINNISGDITNIISSISGTFREQIDELSARSESSYSSLVQMISGVNEYHTIIEKDLYEQMSKTIISASYSPYSAAPSGSVLQLTMFTGDKIDISISDIDYIIENYQPIVVSGLMTDDKTVSGSINEVYQIVQQNTEDIYSLSSIVTSASGDVYSMLARVEALEKIIGNAYFNAKYENSILTLYRFNGDTTSLLIDGGCHHSGCCCCPIFQVKETVDNLEEYITNHSGECKDLEARVATLENEVDIDNPLIIDYTTDPIRIEPIHNGDYDKSSYRETGFMGITIVDEHGVTTNPFPYVALQLRHGSELTEVDMYADTDGDMTLEELGVTEESMSSCVITKIDNKRIITDDFNSAQEMMEEFDDVVKKCHVHMNDGSTLKLEDAQRLFNRMGFLENVLSGIGVTEENFSKMVITSGDKEVRKLDIDEALAYIAGHTKQLGIEKAKIEFFTELYNE